MFCIRIEDKMSSFLQLYMSEKCEYYIFFGFRSLMITGPKIGSCNLAKVCDAKTTPRYQIFRKVSWIFCSKHLCVLWYNFSPFYCTVTLLLSMVFTSRWEDKSNLWKKLTKNLPIIHNLSGFNALIFCY